MTPGPVDFSDWLPARGAGLVAVPFGDDVAHQAIRPGLPDLAQAFLPASRLFRPARTLAQPQFQSLAEHRRCRVRGVHHHTRRLLGFGARDDTLAPVLQPVTAQPYRCPGQKKQRQSQIRYRHKELRNHLSIPATEVNVIHWSGYLLEFTTTSHPL